MLGLTWRGVSILVTCVAASTGCGGHDKAPSTAAGGGGATTAGAGPATSGAGGASGASGAGTAGSGGKGGSSGGANMAGGGGSSAGSSADECQVLKDGETGAHGLTRIYQTKNQGTATFPVGIEGDQLYFTADSKLMAYPLTGGAVKELGPLYGEHELVRDGKIYGVTGLSQEPMRKLFSAPVADVSTLTTLAEGIENPYRLVADDTGLYFDRRQNPSIFKVPLAGGAPVELVPGGRPNGMVAANGFLYWIDSATEHLERVPVAGGPREQLVPAPYGGPMVAVGTTLYWINRGPNTVDRWDPGATKAQTLTKSTNLLATPFQLAVGGDTVFWVGGIVCGELNRVNTDGTGAGLYARGTNGAEWVGMTDDAVFVLGDGALYRADR
jgi:hypothetical protein